MIKLVECPRDAMQGLNNFIPADMKAEYLNLLLQVGFDTLDFGSFVSHRVIPQMKDTAEVVDMLDLSGTKTRLLAIAANTRGAEEAANFEKITYIGFPFSVSETFQQRNTHSGILESLSTVEHILNICSGRNKKAVIYISMAFGNPYGDHWDTEVVAHWTNELVNRGCSILSLADTTGVSTPDKIRSVFPALTQQFPGVTFGVHLHSTPDTWHEKVNAAYLGGCTRFDSALKGFGGCPMADNKLTGNIATENLIGYLSSKGEELDLDMNKWSEAVEYSSRIFHAIS